MTWRVGLSIGESFAEISVSNSDETISRRWLLSKQTLSEGIKSFLQDHKVTSISEARISTRHMLKSLTQNTGQPVAMLLTSGFEAWPLIRQPLFGPHRAASFLSTELIFGITERTSPEGEIIRGIDETEIGFLIEKLKLTETKNVVLGFLHSQLNPQNEKTVAKLMGDAGLNVICSHEVSNSENEVARWWRAMFDCYSLSAMQELYTQIESAGLSNFKLWNCAGKLQGRDEQPAYTMRFGLPLALNNLFHTQKEIGTILCFGLEEFFLLDPSRRLAQWPTEWATLAVDIPHVQKLLLQPTQLMRRGLFGALGKSEKQLSYEPGPMCLGKSLSVTALDLLFLQNHLSAVSGLSEYLQPQSRNRIIEALFMLVKDSDMAQFSRDELIAEGEHYVQRVILHDILNQRPKGQILCTGALAKPFYNYLQKNSNLKVILDDKHEFIDSWATLRATPEAK